MCYHRTPFLTTAERRSIEDNCVRTADGCLLHRPGEKDAPFVTIRGKRYVLARVWWAEHFATTVAAQNALDHHEVNHIAECPHPGFSGGDICIEPTHLILGDRFVRVKNAHERKEAYL